MQIMNYRNLTIKLYDVRQLLQFVPSRQPQKLSVASLIANQGVVISIPTRPDPYFREDLSSNIFYGLSSPASDFRRAAVSYKRKYV